MRNLRNSSLLKSSLWLFLLAMLILLFQCFLRSWWLASSPIFLSFLMLRLKGGEFAIGMWVLASILHLLVDLDSLIKDETWIS